MQNLTSVLKQFNNKKILVIGDVMADEYLWGRVERISPEAPVQIVKINKETLQAGGAANLAHNISSLGAHAMLVGCVGTDKAAEDLLSFLIKNRIDCSAVIEDQNKPTIRKVRVVGQNQQLIRLDYEDSAEVKKPIEDKLLASFKSRVSKVDAVAISDYNKGTLSERIIPKLIAIAKEHDKLIITDTKKEDISIYKGVDLVTPNHKEAGALTGIKGQTNEDVVSMGKQLSSKLNGSILITRAGDGMSLFNKSGEIFHFPTEAKEVFDVSGAGDTVVAALVLCLASGLAAQDAVLVANQAAAIQVGKVGTATVEQKELVKKFEKEQGKIRPRSKIESYVKQAKADGKKVVFTSGCFDLLHVGHITLLRQASKLGDILVVGLNTDESVSKIKGENRPVVKQEQRAEMLSFLDFIDAVTFFNEDTPEQIISELKPDVFVKGGDYKEENLPEAKVVNAYGGEVRILPFVKGFSSSNIINQILSSNIETLNKL